MHNGDLKRAASGIKITASAYMMWGIRKGTTPCPKLSDVGPNQFSHGISQVVSSIPPCMPSVTPNIRTKTYVRQVDTGNNIGK